VIVEASSTWSLLQPSTYVGFTEAPVFSELDTRESVETTSAQAFVDPRRRYGDRPRSNKGKVTRISGEPRGKIQDEVTLPEKLSNKKYFVLQLISLPKRSGAARTYLRLGYYVIGRTGRSRGKWVWANRSPLIFKEDLLKLIRKAKQHSIM